MYRDATTDAARSQRPAPRTDEARGLRPGRERRLDRVSTAVSGSTAVSASSAAGFRRRRRRSGRRRTRRADAAGGTESGPTAVCGSTTGGTTPVSASCRGGLKDVTASPGSRVASVVAARRPPPRCTVSSRRRIGDVAPQRSRSVAATLSAATTVAATAWLLGAWRPRDASRHSGLRRAKAPVGRRRAPSPACDERRPARRGRRRMPRRPAATISDGHRDGEPEQRDVRGGAQQIVDAHVDGVVDGAHDDDHERHDAEDDEQRRTSYLPDRVSWSIATRDGGSGPA